MFRARLSTKLLAFLYQALFFLTPLVFCFATHELFEFPKMVFVYVLTASITLAFVLGNSRGDWGGLGRLGGEGKRLIKLVGLFFLGYLLATTFSQHLYTSLFGYYTRFNGGLLSLICYLTLAVIFWASFGGHVEQIKRFLRILLASSFLVSGYAIAQHFGWDKELWVQNSQARVFSTLGQPNWLAAWAAVVFPINLALLLEARVKKVRREENLYFILAVLNFAAAWFTYSLSGLLGLAVATLTFLYLSPKEILKGSWGVLGRLFLVMVIIAILQPGIFGDRVIWTWRNLRQKIALSITALAQSTDLPASAPGRLALLGKRAGGRGQARLPAKPQPAGGWQAGQEFEVKGSTANIRLEVWKGSLDLIKNHWLIGTGPETFAYSFLPYRPASLNDTTEWDFLYNKAHNEYLNLAAGIGVPGLVVYLLLLPAVLSLVLREVRGGKGMIGEGLVIAGLTAGWVSLWVTNFFGFSVVATSLLFWLIPALILSLTIQPFSHLAIQSASALRQAQGYGGPSAIQPPGRSRLAFTQRIPKATAIVSAIWLLVTSGKIFLADIYYAQGLTKEKQNLPVSGALAVQTATQLNPNEPAYHRELAYLYYLSTKLSEGEDKQVLLKYADEEAQIAYDLNPNNSLTLKSIVKIYSLLATIDPQNPIYFEKALKVAEHNTQLCPTDPKAWYNLGVVYQVKEDNTKAKEALEKALELKNDYAGAREEWEKLK